MEDKENGVKITFIDLFAGIGRFHLAVKEIVKDCRCVFTNEA